MQLLDNYHTHCTFCDGENTAEEMVQEAIRLGFERIGMSSHADTWFDPEYRLDTAGYLAEIARLREVYRSRIDVICGVEAENLGAEDPAGGRIHLGEVDAAGKAEYRIGSTHYLHVGDRYVAVDNTESEFRFLAEEYFRGDYYALSRAYYDLESKVVENTECTFIGHFDLITRFNDTLRVLDETSKAYLDPALEVMRALTETGIPFEINMGAFARGRKKEPYPSRYLLKKLHEFGGRIVISSDAHRRELLSGGFREAQEAAKACGFTHTNILVREGEGLSWKEVALDE